VGAQAAVAPILLTTFGSVPLLAPIANLVAAPVVVVSTTLGAVGVIVPGVGDLARLIAGVVLDIGAWFAGGPQLGWVGVAVAILLGIGGVVAVIRPIVVAVGLLTVLVVVSPGAGWPSVPTLTVLDVGQGDAILVQDPDGGALLFDGGSDPAVLDRALRRHGVRRLDTVVVSHGDIDHAGGLVDLVARRRVGRLVASAFTADSLDIVDLAHRHAVPVVVVEAGDRLSVGPIRIQVLGPGRRYASDNDGSIVLLVEGDPTVLLPGDIEAVAQQDLPELRPVVMVVPHHGSATSDLRWLRDVSPDVAILSYGSNRYGHPHPDVLATLEQVGSRIRRTATEGDISVSLRRVASGPST
ncbi:MAG: MBL fold metallo-hydrolase, partial [Acidimicrobiia bacterium]|nr:MBL fold metallo-hydrolase [Acidimicrobiia bacterium]